MPPSHSTAGQLHTPPARLAPQILRTTPLEFSQTDSSRPASSSNSPTSRHVQAVNNLKTQGLPYPSTHGAPDVKLNGKLLVAAELVGAQPPPREFVCCRHMSMLFAQHPGKKSELMKVFSSKAGIHAQFDQQLAHYNKAYLQSIQQAPPACKHVFDGRQLGRYLKALAEALEETQKNKAESQQESVEVNCLLNTDNHCMALHVQRKMRQQQAYFAVKLYDPNRSAHYKRVVKPTAQELGGLQFNDLLVDSNQIKLYSLGLNKPVPITAVCLDSNLQPAMDRNIISASAENLHLALFDGSLIDVQHILEATAENLNPQPSKSRAHFELLKARYRPHGTNGFFMALHNGHAETVKAFTQWVLNADDNDLNKADKVNLLSAHISDGTQGLFMAFQNGHAQTVKVFTLCILNAEEKALSKDAKINLLRACKSNGTTGLFIALHNGHTPTVTTFMHCILNAADNHLSKTDKVNLLNARTDDGVSGLQLGLHNGFAETVAAFEASIKDSLLDEITKATLLSQAPLNQVDPPQSQAPQGGPYHTGQP